MKAIEMTLTYIGISAVPQSIMPRPLINSLVVCRGLKKNTLANQMHMIIPYRQIHFHSKNRSLALCDALTNTHLVDCNLHTILTKQIAITILIIS